MNILIFLIKYLLCPNLAILTFVNFTTYLDLKTASLPPLSFTPNLTTVTHFTAVYYIPKENSPYRMPRIKSN